MAIEPIRTPVVRQAVSSKPTQSPGKLTPVVSGTVKTTNPFGSLLQSLNTTPASSSSSTTANIASLFGPSASLSPSAISVAPTRPTTPVTTPAAASVQAPGIQALVAAITNGSFQATYQTDPSKLQETTPVGKDYMPNFYYASDATANQLASLLGGSVVQRPAFGQQQGWTEPLANFIQLPNGQTFNAADLAYYARCGNVGAAQLTADITQSINEGAAWTNYYQHGGSMPSFPMGYVGPPISGMTYPAGTVGSDGNVINPAMQS